MGDWLPGMTNIGLLRGQSFFCPEISRVGIGEISSLKLEARPEIRGILSSGIGGVLHSGIEW